MIFLCVYKMFNITKETLGKNGIEVIVDSANALWLNEKKKNRRKIRP